MLYYPNSESEKMNNNTAPRLATEVISRAISTIRAVMPRGWNVKLQENGITATFLEITGPSQSAVKIAVVPRLRIEKRDVPGIRLTVQNTMGTVGDFLIAPPYISRRVQEYLITEGISFADATGNIRLSVNEPGLYVRDRGADKNPWRRPGRPLAGLKGEPAKAWDLAPADGAGRCGLTQRARTKPFRGRKIANLDGAE